MPIPALAGEVVTQWAMPAIAIPEAERPTRPDVLGTVALPIRTQPTSTRWSKLMHATANDWLGDFTAKYRDLPRLDQAIAVQSAINHAVFSNSGTDDCSDDGYWAPASETVNRGLGDCFDIAIAKMEALHLLGFSSRDLYLTTGRFRTAFGPNPTRQSVALLVRIDDRFWLLSERGDRIVELGSSADASEEFSPVITYGTGMTWIHGRVIPRSEAPVQAAR